MTLRGFRSAAVIVLLLAVPVALLTSAGRDPQELGAFGRAIRRVGAPLEAALSYSAAMLGAVFERWILQARLQDDNETLRDENAELTLRVRELARLEEENRELRRTLQMRDRVSADMVAAERVGVEQSPFFRVEKIRIDRGDRAIGAGMAVLAADGVVGRIDRLVDEYGEVMLVTDPRSKIAVEVARTRAQGILQGMGEDMCALRLPKDLDVQVGDLVQTSGVDERFPEGQPVGQVVAVEQLVGDQQQVEVLPAVRFDRVDAMWVVLADAPAPDPRAGQRVEAIHATGWQPMK